MKLVSLYITNFGNLSDVEYKFNGDITSFCEKNGYGKSTLVGFIKSMFYGMETFKKNAASFLDREHYYPFKGGLFGGNIVFEYNNHTYRIERTFDQKSEVDDTLKVYKDTELTEELGDVPGLTIFGISKDSFERLIIINTDKINIESNADISKKLNNYASNVSEDFDITKVIDTVKKLKKEETTKINGNKDTTGLKEKIKNLKEEIANLEGIKSSLDDKYSELDDANKAYQESSILYQEAASKGVILEKWNQYDSLNNECFSLKEKIDVILNRYKKGVPTSEEISLVKKSLEQIKIANASLERGSITVSEENEYKSLSDKYSAYLPSEEEVHDIERKNNELNNLIKDRANLDKKEKPEEEIRLEAHFHGKIVSDEEVLAVKEKVDEYSRLNEELKNIKPNVETTKENEKKVNKLYVISLILLFIVLGAGIGLVFVNTILGIVLASIGGVGFIAVLILLLISYNKEPRRVVEITPNEDYENQKRDIDRKKQEIFILLARYQYVGNDVLSLFYQFKSDAEKYNSIINLTKDASEKAAEYDNGIEKLTEEISSFFNKLNFPSMAFDKAIEILKKELARLEILKGIVNNSSVNKEQLKATIKEEQVKVNAFYEKYEISKLVLIEDIEKDIDDLNRLNNDYKNKLSQRDKYKEDNGLETRVEGESEIDLNALKANEEKNHSIYMTIKGEVEDLEEQVSLLDEKKNELERLNEAKQEAEYASELYENVKKEIEAADESLINKYVAPIKEKFIYYAELLEKAIGEKVHMDKNFKITFDREGALRKSDHLSSGTLAICALCFRLALLDNMFENEELFIIMDDPFMSLDEEHFEKAKTLVKELSKNKQIMYLTCHRSREI